MISIRDANLHDAGRILEIYDYYVCNTAITFEYATPSLDVFKRRMQSIMERYPYLVILDDDYILGYTYASSFISRAAYDWSCEMTIYLDRNARHSGLGRRLYEELEDILAKMGILNLYACISYPDTDDEYLTGNSVEFHRHLGYNIVGIFNKCGYKFNRWYNMMWMEKIIGEHSSNQRKICNYNDL